jgi:transcriptional regulator with XRE-family HTH domain
MSTDKNKKNDIFSARLNELMGKKIKQKDIANACNVSQPSVSGWQSGVVPGGEELYKLANFLQVPVEALFSPQTSAAQKSTGGTYTLEIAPKEMELRDAPVPEEKSCRDYLDQFLSRCAGDPARFGWTLVELRAHFPLDKWDKKG